MSLEVGSRIAHYDVTALIGEGGMGQVYQATDTKLKRQVALKILPEAFATDPDRLARFQREAQVLASLNHPGIAAIYGIEEEGGTRALVLELVEGPTLADRIAKGPIPLDEALPIAKQIAEALEAAHEAGVIHRDLKPANIKVRDDGTVKVLDFGLAKALDTTPHGDPSQSPTLTAAATQMGVIMGTAAYMSPEQARGRPVDRRADIWAFGCVLYEMLTGQRAFPGADVSDTLVAVITADVDLDALPTATPARIRHVLKACLQKETKDRVRDIGDVGLAMTGVFETAVSNVPAGAARPARRWSTLPLAVGASASALVFAGVSFWTADRPAAPPVSRFVVSAPVLPGSAPDLISPDGRTIVFGNAAGGIVGQEQMFVRRLDEVEAVPLLGAQGTVPKAFTPDGQELLFTDGSVLKSVPLTGGSATTLVEASFGVGIISTPEGMVWGSPTGLWLGSPSGPQLLAGPAEGESGNYYQPRTLPDGRGEAAYKRARRPKATKFRQCPRLRTQVESMLNTQWSPQQISARLPVDSQTIPRCVCPTKPSIARCSSKPGGRCAKSLSAVRAYPSSPAWAQRPRGLHQRDGPHRGSTG